MTLTGGGGAIEFESSCIVIYFSHIYLGINGERSVHEINQGLKLWARNSIAASLCPAAFSQEKLYENFAKNFFSEGGRQVLKFTD